MRRRQRWLGYVLRREPQTIIRMALHWAPDGNRMRGRPRITWRGSLGTMTQDKQKGRCHLNTTGCNDWWQKFDRSVKFHFITISIKNNHMYLWALDSTGNIFLHNPVSLSESVKFKIFFLPKLKVSVLILFVTTNILKSGIHWLTFIPKWFHNTNSQKWKIYGYYGSTQKDTQLQIKMNENQTRMWAVPVIVFFRLKKRI